MTSRLSVLATAVVTATSVLVSPAVAAPAQAAAPPQAWAFVRADQPTPAPSCYHPVPGFQGNSSTEAGRSGGDPTLNTICRTGVGAYAVYLSGLGAAAGTVLVTAWGSTSHYCKVVSWGPSGTNQRVNVRCFGQAGAAADTRFTMSYVRQTGTGGHPFAYLWATALGTAPTPYQFNSTGALNTVTHPSPGQYVVTLPGLGAVAGHVQVTAYGMGNARCKVTSWGPSATSQRIGVRCFTPAGALVNSAFTLTYARDGNILREKAALRDGHQTAYAWANQPTTTSYAPAPNYRFTTSGNLTITRLSQGDYVVNWPHNEKGTVHVTAYGPESEHCKVHSWTAAQMRVRCFSTTGRLVDARYTVTFVGPYLIG